MATGNSQLGLPPMQLAESSANNVVDKEKCTRCLLWTVEKLAAIFVFVLIVGGYFFFRYYIIPSIPGIFKSTPVEHVQEQTTAIIFRPFQVREDENLFYRRFKRDTSLTNKTPGNKPQSVKFSDDQFKKAREIIMSHNVECKETDKQGICKDLVTKIKAAANEKSDALQQKRNFEFDYNDNINKIKDEGRTTTDVTKREALPTKHLESIIESVHPFSYTQSMPHNDHSTHNNCLLKLLKNIPQRKELLNPVLDYMPLSNDPHYQHSLLPQARYFSHDHASYPHGYNINMQPHKIHPQDVDIRLNMLTPKSERTATENPFNSTSEVSCPTGSVPCTSGTCIDKKQWCDGNVDCPDVSDEARCTCKSRVDKSRLCDGYFDCPFGEDEMGCNGCNDNTFSCDDIEMTSRGTCFTKEQRCNNIVDCPNQKDELECNMLAPSLLNKPIFAISNTEGFLHRNFKGDWFAVCRNPYMWAHDVCRRETGLIIRPPIIQIVPMDPMIKVNYINTDLGGGLQTSDNCFNSSAIYVTCPDMLCGTRVPSTSQFLRENTAVENRLFGRNKRFYQPYHPYPVRFYEKRWKRNAEISNDNTKIKSKSDKLNAEESLEKIRSKRTESRVVGGKPSQPAAWPWMVAMYRDGMFHCGGVVITHSWIISAAHCVQKFWYHYYEIQVGMLRRFSYSPQEQSHKVTHVIVNQHYSQKNMKNDLSLLKVEPAIQFSRWVRPICLPSPDTAGDNWFWGPPPGTVCTAVGWGSTTEHGPDPDHMREVEVPVWETCKHEEDRAGKEICAGMREGGKDACQGDSGGPLLCKNPLNSQQWYMAGIVSHGDGCGRKGEPGVYTRVSLFVKWIKYHISSDTLPKIQPKQECPGFKCETGISKCLPKKRKCDGIVDCLGAEDEMDCEIIQTISPLSRNIFVNPIPIVENFFVKKEAKSDSVTETSKSSETEDFTTSPIVNVTYTTEAEIITSTNNLKLKSENKTQEDINFPEFNKASTLEISISKSSEDPISSSMEHVTSDPVGELNDLEDVETITITFTGKPLISASSVLAHLKEKTTETNIDTSTITNQEISTFIGQENETSTTEFVTKKGEDVTTVPNDHTTPQMNLLDDNITAITTHSPVESLHERTANKSDVDIVELLPFSHSDIAGQTSLETKHNNISDTKRHESTSAKALTDFDKNESENIREMKEMFTSELQPASVRRKHRAPAEYQCRRIFQMIPYLHRCDRKADCEDGTDELDCTCSDYLATFDEKLICDGVFDCADGHDELNCFSCSEDQYLCKQSQMCLPLKHVCDGQIQCPYGEDELDCFSLTDGKEIVYDMDERPVVNLEGYLTNKHKNDWHVVCDDKLSLEQQELAATHICRYLGFSSANKFYVKYINIKEDEITKRMLESQRRRRDATRKPIHFAYRQESDNNDTVQHTIIKEVQVIKEQCVPNITKTCKSLYVFCDHTLYTNFEIDVLPRNTENTPATYTWPWAAKIYLEGEYRCTGVLVNLSWVLVSQSCLWDATLSLHYVSVVLGSLRELETTRGMFEQIYQVDAKQDIYNSRSTLLHLAHPAHYSNMVKPMVVTFTYEYLDSKSTCVAIGQDPNNNTITVKLQETTKNCHLSNRCFVRETNEEICPPNTSTNRHWAGIISCHTDQGWFPAASFVNSKGECGLGTQINATNIGNLKNELKHLIGKKSLPSQIDTKSGDHCEGVRCGRGRCVSLAQMCDGVRDCEDGNDESETVCEKKKTTCNSDLFHKGCECSAGQMKCRNGKCISKELFRDGIDDCGDLTDEPGQSTCSLYLARVMPSRLCDGILHCLDRSDEDPMFCKCFAKKSYKCGTKAGVDHCVAPDMVCDGVRDCPNGEDESSCIGLNAPQGTPYGTGQVIVRSHGVWHSKCYTKKNHTKSELEDICAQLGFVNGHAKQIHDVENFVINQYNNLVIDPFIDIFLNNNTVIKMRNTLGPIATAIVDKNLDDCHPVVIECM